MTQVCGGTQAGTAGRLRRGDTCPPNLSSAASLPCDLMGTVILPNVRFPTWTIREMGCIHSCSLYRHSRAVVLKVRDLWVTRAYPHPQSYWFSSHKVGLENCFFFFFKDF